MHAAKLEQSKDVKKSNKELASVLTGDFCDIKNVEKKQNMDPTVNVKSLKKKKRKAAPERLNTSKYSKITEKRPDPLPTGSCVQNEFGALSQNTLSVETVIKKEVLDNLDQSSIDTKCETKVDQIVGEKKQNKREKYSKDPHEKLKKKIYKKKLKQMREEKSVKRELGKSSSKKSSGSDLKSSDETGDDVQESKDGKHLASSSTSKQCLYLQRSDTTYKRKLDFNTPEVGHSPTKVKKDSNFVHYASQKQHKYENEFRDFLSRGRGSGASKKEWIMGYTAVKKRYRFLCL